MVPEVEPGDFRAGAYCVKDGTAYDQAAAPMACTDTCSVLEDDNCP